MGLFDRLKAGLKRTQEKLGHEIRRVVSRSPKLTGDSVEELESLLLGADLGAQISWQILTTVKREYETQGKSGDDFFEIATREIVSCFKETEPTLVKVSSGPTIVSMIGVNGTGKTTTSAKLAWRCQQKGETAMLAACDTFRAAAIEQLKLWGERLDVPVVAGTYGADPASVAHDAVTAAQARALDYLFVDTAGRLHTKSNLMDELQKLHRVVNKKLSGAPHESLLVLDGSTGMNAVQQAKAFAKAVDLTGLVITKLDGTSKGGGVVSIQKELGLPVKFIGVGEQPEDLQPFNAREFASALFSV